MRFFCKIFNKKKNATQKSANTLQINIITSTTASFPGSLGVSIFQKALQNEIFKINLIDLKKFASKNNRIDDYPFGGGAGLVIKADVLQNALNYAIKKFSDKSREQPIIIVPSAKGRLFDTNIAKSLASQLQASGNIFFVSGRFEGMDQRFINANKIMEVSIGNFIVAGGDAPIITMCEAILRFVPNVLGNSQTHASESYQMNFCNEFSTQQISQIIEECLQMANLQGEAQYLNRIDLLKKILQHLENSANIVEYNQYTRPAVWNGIETPKVLTSGNHLQINKHRTFEAVKNTVLKYLIDNAKKS